MSFSNTVDNLFRWNYQVIVRKQSIENNAMFKNSEGVESRVFRGSFREGIDDPNDYAAYDDSNFHELGSSYGTQGEYNLYEMIQMEREDAEIMGGFLDMHFRDLIGKLLQFMIIII